MLSDEKSLENGVPQGENLSVILFLIAMNKLEEYLPQEIKIGLFADDLVIYCSGKNINTIKLLLQRALRSLELWSQTTGFHFSTQKTKAVHFTKTHYYRYNPRLTIYEEPIKYSENIKFLGLILDNKLNWKEHLRKLKLECNQRLNILKALGHYKWGAHRDSLLKVYQTLVKSKIDYGSIFYGLAKKTYLKPIEAIQNTAIRIATGAFRTSPSDSLQAESSQMPLHQRRKLLTLNYLTNLATNPTIPVFKDIFYNSENTLSVHTYSSLHTHIRDYLLNSNLTFPLLENRSYNAYPPWTLNRPSFNVTLNKHKKSDTQPGEFRQGYLEIISQYDGFTKIFTDGSKVDGRTGAAFTAEETVFKFRLPNASSVFTAELYSIYQASEYIVNDNSSNQFIIQTDSYSTIQSLQQIYSNNTLVQRTQDNFHRAATNGKEVQILWVPSHVGIEGNERADQAAKDATNLDNINTLTASGDFKSYVKLKVKQSWEQTWRAKINNKLRRVKPTTARWYTGGDRSEQVIITRIRIGHTRLTHSYLFQRTDPPSCEHCGRPLTVEHIIIECIKYNQARTRYSIPATLEEALENKMNTLTNVLKFLKDIKITPRL